MELGKFSISLAVKDLSASRAFYEKLGFRMTGGDPAQHWLVLRNGTTTIGLFQGMFERNLLTFNPGWDAQSQPVAGATDIRVLQQELEAQGVELRSKTGEGTTGPASFMVVDPDGNEILVDQHV